MLLEKLLENQENDDPSSLTEPPDLIVARDGDSHWVVVETHGLCGGFFVDEATALRYARQESRGRPNAVRVAPRLSALNVEPAPKGPVPARR